jgi:hypothetical protein
MGTKETSNQSSNYLKDHFEDQQPFSPEALLETPLMVSR